MYGSGLCIWFEIFKALHISIAQLSTLITLLKVGLHQKDFCSFSKWRNSPCSWADLVSSCVWCRTCAGWLLRSSRSARATLWRQTCSATPSVCGSCSREKSPLLTWNQVSFMRCSQYNRSSVPTFSLTDVYLLMGINLGEPAAILWSCSKTLHVPLWLISAAAWCDI